MKLALLTLFVSFCFGAIIRTPDYEIIEGEDGFSFVNEIVFPDLDILDQVTLSQPPLATTHTASNDIVELTPIDLELASSITNKLTQKLDLNIQTFEQKVDASQTNIFTKKAIKDDIAKLMQEYKNAGHKPDTVLTNYITRLEIRYSFPIIY